MFRWCLVVLSAILTAVGPSTAAPPLLTPHVVWIPTAYHTGGAYTAIQAAPDGTVYLGTTHYEGFGRFLAMTPGGREFRLITDTGTATGESTLGPYSQAKIHTKPVIDANGKVYFGTKSGKPANDPRWQAQYPGGHLLVYDPRTTRVSDLGIPRPRQSIIALGLDRRRDFVYVLTDPEGHLITFDTRTRAFIDHGQFIPAFAPTRYLVVLASGDAYHPAGPGAFLRYGAEAQRIEQLSLHFSGGGTYEISSDGHGPYAMAASLDGLRFHGVGESSGQVYTFTPVAEKALQVHMHGSALPRYAAIRMSHYTMAAGPNGSMYYTATLYGGSSEGSLYILRLSMASGRPEIVGQVAPLSPPPPAFAQPGGRLQVQGSTFGRDGTLYVMLAYPLRVLIFPNLAAP